jgi:hypothetical protein
MAKKSVAKLIIYAIFLVISFFSLIALIRDGSGLFLNLEIIGLIFMLLLTVIGLAGYNKAWGERVLFFVFLLYIINLVLMWYFRENLYLVLLLIGLIGFFMALPKKEDNYIEPKSPSEDPHNVAFDKPVKESKGVHAVKKVNSTAAKHSPGKYVASKRSNIYHAPKCEWAKKIKKERQKWFATKEEAWEEGYKAHNCVE